MNSKLFLLNIFKYRKTLCPVSLMKLEKSRSSRKFNINLDFFIITKF